MKKFPGALCFLIMALAILSLSGCGGGGGSGSSQSAVETSYEVKQVAVLTSPAFEMYKNYTIYTGAVLTGMDTARYYVANVGDESSQTTLNLGLSEELSANSTLAVVNPSTGAVVFAYNPSGNENEWKTGGNVRATGGKLMRYRSLTIDGSASTDQASVKSAVNLDVDDSSIVNIVLNKDKATMTNPDYVEDYDPEYDDPIAKYSTIDVPSYTYVWHADPSHRYEYYTKGSSNTTTLGNGEEGYDYTYEDDFNDDNVYIARDIRYITSAASFSESQTAVKDNETEYVAYYSDSVASAVEDDEGEDYPGPYIFATLPKSQNSSLSETKSLMTHSASDAYKNPVLHIRSKGVYSLSGTWTGQISVEANAIIILNGVTITCTVGPAFVFADPNADFYNYTKEYGETDESVIASDYLTVGQTLLDTLLSNDANIVVVADGTTNNITGSNVYRILKAEPKSSAEKVDGTDISDQIKLCKMDGAFYSYVSLAICGGAEGTGVLNITSTSLEGLGSELHMTIEGGNITINSPEDGINVNEDDVSVFTMLDGTLTINSTTGDGIDSNGYVVINGGSLDITAGSQKTNSAGEAGIDAEKEIYISDAATYTWTAASGSSQPTPPDSNPPSSSDVSPDVKPDASPDITPTSLDSTVTPPAPVYEPDDSSSSDSTDSTDTTESTDTDTTTDTTDTTTDTTTTVSDDSTVSNDFDWDSFWANWSTQSQTQQGSTTSSYTYSDADVLKGAVQTERGVTAINIGTGSNASFIKKDTDTKPRNINSSGNVFRLDRKVNTFSAIAF
ncbi:MAG: carbohydrate-binding domain-containing protein [Synergistaceae bacterium]|nr:carbohydrate-binding domain-containing protein [Synergistaceae bacterium]